MTIYLGHQQIDHQGPRTLKLFLESLNETSSNIFPLSSLGIEVCLAQSVSPTYLLFLALSECPSTTSLFPSFSTLNILKLQQSLLKLDLFLFTDCLDLGFVPRGPDLVCLFWWIWLIEWSGQLTGLPRVDPSFAEIIHCGDQIESVIFP